jgi:hypothetical protein
MTRCSSRLETERARTARWSEQPPGESHDRREGQAALALCLAARPLVTKRRASSESAVLEASFIRLRPFDHTTKSLEKKELEKGGAALS